MAVTDAEKAFYESVIADPEGKSIQDLRYAYFLAALDGGLPGGGGGGGTVSSVNGKTGAVVLTSSDVGAVAEADVAGLDTPGWGRAVFIANGGTVPVGTPPYTIVIEEA